MRRARFPYRPLLLIASLLALAYVLAGCGGTDTCAPGDATCGADSQGLNQWYCHWHPTDPQCQPAATNLIQNASLESLGYQGVPHCWERAGWGSNQYSWIVYADAHDGRLSQHLHMSWLRSGDQKLMIQRSDSCAPKVTPGHQYVVTAWYKSNAPVQLQAYPEDSSGNWAFWTGSQAFPAAGGWTKATWVTPPVPANVKALSIGLALGQAGDVTMDDFGMVDQDAGSTPPPPQENPDMAVPPPSSNPDMATPPPPPDMATPPPTPDLSTPPPQPDMSTPPPPVSGDVVPPTLFGLHMHDAATRTAWPGISFGAWRFWDTHTSWKEINTSPGVYDWSLLDKLVALGQQHGVKMIYTVALTPVWDSSNPTGSSTYAPGTADPPKDLTYYQQFVTALVTRYKGKISAYEGWNEPNLTGQFYNGSPASLVPLQQILYNTVKRIDPGAQVVSPSCTSLSGGGSNWFDQFLAAGGKGYFDVVGFHLYTWPNSPESLAFNSNGELDHEKAVLAKYGLSNLPLWNTEAGWETQTLGQTTTAAYVTRMYILGWANGVDRYFFYAWDQSDMGVFYGGQVGLPGIAMGNLYDWMVGASMPSCSQSGSVYTCPLTRANGYQGWIVWNASGSSSYRLPSGARTEHGLDGSTSSVSGGSSITVSGLPVLIDNQ